MTKVRQFCQFCIAVALTIVVSSCGQGQNGPTEPDVDGGLPLETEYTLIVTSSAGDSTIYRGSKATWSPDIGYLRLGPEEVSSGPIASFALTVPLSCIDFDELKIIENCPGEASFYSIEFPGNNLGDQNAINFTQISVERLVPKIGIDDIGLTYVFGEAEVKFSSIPPVIGERLTEEVTVSAFFIVYE